MPFLINFSAMLADIIVIKQPPVEGLDHTGPLQFKSEKLIDLEDMFEYIRSWAAYQLAKDKGLELLNEEVIEEFKNAWNKDGDGHKVAKISIYLRIGKVLSHVNQYTMANLCCVAYMLEYRLQPDCMMEIKNSY
ncbi:hypothetical protein RJ641_004330 [Dillenia turbinata]|uniref:Uncharacterized protein n=1 Tax=Dillenia turbinata TaxID=194707 RepID=A0AAN8VI60_9MAGN